MHDSKAKRGGFTLIELLVVISIISFLASVVFASLNSARDKARLAHALEFDQSVNHAIGDVMTDSMEFDNNIFDSGEDIGYITSDAPPIYVSDGIRGAALHFDGTSRKVNIWHDTPIYSSFSSYSISLWFRTTTKNNQSIVWRNTGGLELDGPRNDGSVELKLWGGSLVNSVASPVGVSFADGKWHHVLAERNYETRSISLYIDGNLQGTSPDSEIEDYFLSDDENWHMGDSNPHFTGDIDSFRVYGNHL